MLSWRRYLRVIVVPSEGRNSRSFASLRMTAGGGAELGIGGRAKLQCGACTDKRAGVLLGDGHGLGGREPLRARASASSSIFTSAPRSTLYG